MNRRQPTLTKGAKTNAKMITRFKGLEIGLQDSDSSQLQYTVLHASGGIHDCAAPLERGLLPCILWGRNHSAYEYAPPIYWHVAHACSAIRQRKAIACAWRSQSAERLFCRTAEKVLPDMLHAVTLVLRCSLMSNDDELAQTRSLMFPLA
jgi:hypothetical protein